MLLRNATLADGRQADVRICLDTIDQVADQLAPIPDETVHDLGGMLLVPALVEPHAHLDKAFLAERIDNPTGDLIGAIRAMEANRHLVTVADTVERAERAVRLMVSRGVTAIRTHADTTRDNGLASIEALTEVRRRTADLCTLQIVALTGWPICGAPGADARALLRAAIAAGADGVGGCPHLDDDPAGANEVFLGIAAETGSFVDLHTDETLAASMLSVEDLARRVISSGFAGRVAASHCCSLGVQDAATQQRVAELIAEAGIDVITLPQTNLFLQGRDQPTATPRGLTAVHALRRAGANVAAGADNLQDPFNLVGRGDPLETAALLVTAAHVLPADAFEACTSAGRHALGLPAVDLTPGSPADLVAIPVSGVREAVAMQPDRRLVMRAGQLVVI